MKAVDFLIRAGFKLKSPETNQNLYELDVLIDEQNYSFNIADGYWEKLDIEDFLRDIADKDYYTVFYQYLVKQSRVMFIDDFLKNE